MLVLGVEGKCRIDFLTGIGGGFLVGEAVIEEEGVMYSV